MKTNPPRRLSLISESTRSFFKAAKGRKELSLIDRLHGYIYGRWPYHYIGILKGDHPWAKKTFPFLRAIGLLPPEDDTPAPLRPHSLTQASGSFADGYHGKALPLESARQLVMVNQPIHVEDLEQVIPYVRARAIIQENPDHIIALECPCRAYKENPCLPLDVCLVVGEPFASFIIEHQPDKARWITQEEAARIIEEEDARGHVHHAFFKDAMLGRFYAICNCCSCCCGAMSAHRHGTPMLASSGYVAQVDTDQCIGCAECQPYCQFGALTTGPEEHTQVLWEKCMGCGVCIDKCPQAALSLRLAPEKGVPLEIEKLMAQAAGE